MELRHLRYFVAVSEELNLTRAAEKLFIAQPPLTRAIKQLEEEIGVALFIRQPRGLELTTCGKYFLEQARQILDERFARGEIDVAEYDERRRRLNDGDGG